MGWRFRKSINLGGGFRVNISRSGVGYSWGVPGYRVTRKAGGGTRQTVSIPGTGVSHVTESNGSRRSNPQSSQPNAAHVNMQAVENADVNQIADASFSEISSAISKCIGFSWAGNWMIVLGLWGVILHPLLIGWVLAIVFKILSRKKAVQLEYSFDDGLEDVHQRRLQGWQELFSSEKVWQITERGSTTNTRRNAGASNVIRRNLLSKPKSKVFWLKSNISPMIIRLQKESMVLLPDKILLISGVKVGAVSFEDIQIQAREQTFIEEQAVPHDTQIIGKTWKYVNRNGTPDKRFKNNRQLPRCLYGQVTMQTPSGLNVQLQCSNPEKIAYFQQSIR